MRLAVAVEKDTDLVRFGTRCPEEFLGLKRRNDIVIYTTITRNFITRSSIIATIRTIMSLSGMRWIVEKITQGETSKFVLFTTYWERMLIKSREC
jgi:hypothetical protein